MGNKKKKRQQPEIEELLARPWCYYCERDFDDLKILIHHQKAKHFKCERCARRLNTAGGLRVHMEQVHKETLEAVDNAIPGRESVDLEIFGTEGIPDNEVAAHNQRIMAEFAQKEADRRAASGQGSGAPKRPKIDISKELDPDEIRKKLEAHKKAMASGGATPATPADAMSPGRSQSPGGFDNPPPQAPYQQQPQAASPPAFQQTPYSVPPSQGFPPQTQNTFSAPYGQPPFQPPTAPFGRGTGPQPPYNGFQQPPGGFPANFNAPPPNQFQQGPSHQRHQPSHTPSLPQPHQIPGLPAKPNVAGLPPRPAFANSGGQSGGFNRGGGAPPGSWGQPQHPQQHSYNQAGSPPPGTGFAQQGTYGPPLGQNQASFTPGFSPPPAQQSAPAHPPPGYGPQGSPHPISTSVPQNGHARNDAASPFRTVGPESVLKVDTVATPETPVEKKNDGTTKPKREMRLVYNDNDMSPEECRAALPRYAAYIPKKVKVEASA